MNQENVLKNQLEAIEECGKQRTQLAWFQSIDELQEHLIPNLVSHGLIRGSCAFSLKYITLVDERFRLLDEWNL